MKQDKLIKKYDKQVPMYVSNQENPTMSEWRRKLIREAEGKVLEVGVGVGANFPYYDTEKVTAICGVDFSSEMLHQARRNARNLNMNTSFIQKDIEKLEIEAESFDCIVSTLTLCSYPDPLKTLNKFNNWCAKDGKVLLLEHGLSNNPLLSFTQKAINPIFLQVSGCHCKRNVLALLEESNLVVEKVERYWSGIINLIWAKPGPTIES
ncbi:class I SAM-dependent methyltransferase [Ornithinibacillus scapharcae]|uniref:class I SAM-dependent methyltransferase n=1 Tax=Ornithinibacillus scapharcae TaxID=1147159 RepID=UPI000225B69B|nr:class I SAM-dependent methyltransferase [Ornithinibacillus scapharcae]